jgi:hypothetical protein
MRIAAAIGIATLCACSTFGEAADVPGTDGGSLPATPDGAAGDGGRADATLEDGAPAPPFCAAAVMGQLLFCSDFEASGDLKVGWGTTDKFTGTFMTAKLFGSNRAAMVSGTMVDGDSDHLLSPQVTLTKPTTALALEIDVFLGAALTNGEIALLDTRNPATSPIIYLSNRALKIRIGNVDSTAGAPLETGVWSHVVLTAKAGITELSVNGQTPITAAAIPGLLDAAVEVGVGLYYKQGAGMLEYALDNIRLTKR